MASLLVTSGCADPKAKAQAELESNQHQLDNVKTQIKDLPLLQKEVQNAQKRVALLEKQRDALKKAGQR